MQFLRATASRWTTVNPVLKSGQPGYEIGTGSIKIGDGVTAWSSLPYLVAAPAPPLTFVRKTADTTRNNTAALTADPDLTIAVAAFGVYEVSGFLIYTASQTADFQMGWTMPSSSTFSWAADGIITTTTSQTGQMQRARLAFNSTATLGGVAADLSPVVARPTGLLVAGAAGNLTLTWAQGTAEASDVQVLKDSFLRLTKIT